MPWLALRPLPLSKAARFVDAMPDDPFWRTLHRLADAQVSPMLTEIAAALVAVGVSLDREALARFLSAGQLAAADALVQEAWQAVGAQGLYDTLMPRLTQLALDAATGTPVGTLRIRFNVQDPDALQAIAEYAGTQITAISATTQEALQGILQRAFESGTPLTQQIDEIAATVGLTPRQADSVARYREGLIAAGEKPGRVQALLDQRTTALRRQRAENIARTEAMTAVHAGQQARWTQAVRDGLLDPTTMRRFWIVTPDDRLCRTICAPIPTLNPEGVGIDTPFQTPRGPILYPVAHPMCRCSVSLREGIS